MRALPVVLLAVLLAGCPPVRGGSDDDDVATPAGSDGPEGCIVQEVAGAECVSVPITEVTLNAWCEDVSAAPRIFTDSAQWNAFLLTCDADQEDPLADLDWSVSHVVGTLAQAGGCSGSAGTSWVARCGAEHHLSYWSTGCGPCDAIWASSHFVIVPASEAVATLLLDHCVPDGEECQE